MSDVTNPVTTLTPVPLKPGWATSEAWLTFLTQLPALALNSGLVANSPLVAKLVSLVIAALAAWGYTANRTNLKKAHLAAQVVPAKAPLAAAVAATLSVLLFFSCATGKAVVAGGETFLQCEGQDLYQIVKDPLSGNNMPLIEAVATDLIAGNYTQLIADLITSLGGQVVGCAVLATDTIAEAGKSNGSKALSPIELHARAMLTKYNWKAAPMAPAKQ